MLKTLEEIYQEMLEVFARQSGYRPHSACDLAARLYAAAAQVQALYAQAAWVLDQSFPQTAQGEFLDYHGETRNISRIAATAAEGVLRFSIDQAVGQNLNIPVGTVCMTAEGVRYETTEAGAISAGRLWTEVNARAVEQGESGNVGADRVVLMAVAPAGVARCTNPQPFTGGADQEDDEALRARILDSYRRLPNGANAAYYEQEAMRFEGVAAAKAVGRPRGVGTVDVYIAAASGAPEEALRQAVEETLQKSREIAVELQVLAPTLYPVVVTVALAPAAGYSFDQAKADAEDALAGFFGGHLLGEAVTLARLGNLLYSLDSVANYRFSAPGADVEALPARLPTLGTVTVTEMEG